MCSIEGCSGAVKARGWCGKHYHKWERHGDPLGGNTSYATPEESFAARTEWQGECLVWTGGVGKTGYPRMTTSSRSLLVYRWVYENSYGVPAKGSHLDHKCRNKRCVNVQHLREVSPKQNVENQSGPPKNNSSGHVGVSWDSSRKRWASGVMHRRKHHHAGRYPIYELHVAAYYARDLRNKLFTHNDNDRNY